MRRLRNLITLFVIGATLIVLVLYSGVLNFAATEPESDFTHWLLEETRERSVARHARDIVAPDLDDAARIARGAPEYAETCAMCHLAPGAEESELHAGLNPRPPNLSRRGIRKVANDFWVVKHGIWLTGMPAFGPTHDDESLWDVVAFVNALPEMSPDAYRELTEPSVAEPDSDEDTPATATPGADAPSGGSR